MLLLNDETLAGTRAQLAAQDPELAPAWDKLRGEAEAALAAGPWSVTSKKSLPPSGDKHDYYSVGPYWWPDPTKPGGLPYLRRDGEINPERHDGDSHGLSHLSQAVSTLALAYHLGGDERCAAHAAALLRVWFLDPATRMNPHLQFGQAIPGICEGRGIGIIDTMALCPLPDAVTMLGDAFSPDGRAGLQTWFADYLSWLQASDHGRDEAGQHNNHGTWYDVQVATLALATDRADVARMTLAAVPAQRIARQIEPDGRQPHELARTKAFSYSLVNLQGFFHLASLAEHVGVDLWSVRGLRAALDFLAPFADPDLFWPHPQIDGGDFRTGLFPLLRRATFVYRAARYQELVAQHGARDERFRLLLPFPAP